MSARETPKFSGIIIYRDPRGRFAVRYPTGWRTFEIRGQEPLTDEAPPAPELTAAADASGGSETAAHGQDGLPPVAPREGIGFAPDARDPRTAFTVWAAPIAEAVVAEDLELLKAGLDEGLRQFEDCRVELASEIVLGNLLRFERIYTYAEPPQRDAPQAIRKRKQWLLYVDRWLLCLTWQGSSPEAYQYWLAMANQSFLTFEIPEALWFYTDRELLAQLRPGTR